jgi:hypothetical protein
MRAAERAASRKRDIEYKIRRHGKRSAVTDFLESCTGREMDYSVHRYILFFCPVHEYEKSSNNVFPWLESRGK